ncbi:MAG: hypothetical protein RLZZ157_1919 [Pseudomonadota bacterium]|jgi:UDP-N-acetylmuramyl pentapeptide phosphotransferase/UDP-N-acetylglucosamine-1-phosphate transferase
MAQVLTAMALAFCVALLATRAMIAIAIPDAPDSARKNHKATTPTSGGIGIVAGIAVGLGSFIWSGAPVPWALLASCCALSGLGAILGLLDDVLELGAVFKLCVMLLACASFVVLGARVEVLDLGLGVVLPLGAVLGGLGSALWLMVLVNGVNFMDGANGLSLGSSAIGLLGLSGLFVVQGQMPHAVLGLIGASACLGFLYWNAGKGRIFAGDCGALAVGLLMGGYGLWAAKMGIGLLNVALCSLPLLVDVVLTVVWRIRRGHNILQAHSFHAYQRLIRSGRSHMDVAVRYWLQTLACVACALVGQVLGASASPLAFVLALLALGAMYLSALQRTPQIVEQ